MSNTQEKLLEAKYFLERMIENQAERGAFKYNLSAFLSASRSVTFIMQNEFGNVKGFTDWYSIEQGKMKDDKNARVLVDKRDVTIHQESVRLRAHIFARFTESITLTDNVSVFIKHADGTSERRNSTPPSPPPSPPKNAENVEWHWYFDEITDTDVIELCKDHIDRLEFIVTECEQLFGNKDAS